VFVMMSAFLSHTKRLRIGSGVLADLDTQPAVIAASWSTMWELGGKVDGKGRVMLGIGAWWEPIAGRVGVVRRNPSSTQCASMWKRSGSFLPWRRSLIRVNLFIWTESVWLWLLETTSPRDNSDLQWRDRAKMLEMAGEICDGVVFKLCCFSGLHS
jgi:5,10-methylenetetrahydromethanopterin reductase